MCTSCGWPSPYRDDATRPLRLGDPADAGHTIGVDLSAAPYVQVLRGPNAGSRWSVRTATTTIGRSSDSDVFLNDVSVSRKHAVLWRSDDSTIIEDLGSLNGTYVNGAIIDDPRPLRSGDLLQVGRYRMVFVG